MSNINDVSDRATKRMRWIARIWGTLVLVIVLFILIGSVWGRITATEADPYVEEGYPFIENLPPLFALLSALGLGLAWRWEGLGGAIAVIFNLAGLPVLLMHWPITRDFARYLIAPYGIWIAIAIPGILFLICWWRSKKKTIPRPSD